MQRGEAERGQARVVGVEPGRADAEGQAISLICPTDIPHFKVIQKKMGKRVPMIWTNELDLHGF